MEIRHLSNTDIDRQKWDQLVRRSHGATLYARSWYLDATCPGWQALILDDYRAGMPLTGRRKGIFSYLYQPLLSQQLGVFCWPPLNPVEVDKFLLAIPREFRLVEITLNDQNPPGPRFPTGSHITCRLSLNRPYDQIAASFTENSRRNIRKAADENLRFRTNIQPDEFLSLLKQDKSAGAAILNRKSNRPLLSRLMNALLHHNAGMICGIKNRQGNLIAAALIGTDKYYHLYLAPAMNEEGRDTRAMFYLIDRYIHLHAGMGVTLDFEGSDIESVARFYKGFGAKPTTYSSLRINRLPWPVNVWANRRLK